MSRSPLTVTVAPGSTALLESVTVPVIEPVCTWAYADAAASRQSPHSTSRLKVSICLLRIAISLGNRGGAGTIRGNRSSVKIARRFAASDTRRRTFSWRSNIPDCAGSTAENRGAGGRPIPESIRALVRGSAAARRQYVAIARRGKTVYLLLDANMGPERSGLRFSGVGCLGGSPRPGPTHLSSRTRCSCLHPATPDPAGPAAQTAVVKQYCAGCHSERGKAGGLSLADFDAAAAADHAPAAEKMIRKLRAGMMPPPGARRPADTRWPRWPTRSRRASTRPRCSTRIRAGVPSSGSTAPSISTRSRICSRSTSTSTRSFRPTRSARASTTWRTSRRFRRP